MINSIRNFSAFQLSQVYRLCVAGLILSAAVLANGQAPGSTRGLSSGDGSHTIQGRVYFPSGTNVGAIVKVNLESNNSTGGGSTTTDQDGEFRFNNIRAGTYAVVVDGGKDYETAREPVNIDPGGTSGPVTSVTIHLRPKVDASNPAFAGVPKAALDLYQKGTVAAQKGNAKSAAEFFSKAVETYPNFAMALNELGVQYMKIGQMDKAAETFGSLVKLKPGDAGAHLDLGIALYNQSTGLLSTKAGEAVPSTKAEEAGQKADQAVTELREALKLNSPGFTAHYYLGMALIRLKKYDEAQKEMELAISTGGENLAQAHRFLGGLYQRAQKNKEAVDELEKYLKLDPKAPDADRIKEIIKTLKK
jgi:Tfp pilus assembly protein PilF